MKKKFISIICMLALLFTSAIPVAALETPEQDVPTMVSTECLQINPLYEDVIDEAALAEELDEIAEYAIQPLSDGEYCTTKSEFSDILRQAMLNRVNTVTVQYENAVNLEEADLQEIMNQAIAESDSPKEGDYLAFQYGGWKSTCKGYYQSGMYYLTVTYTISYYTTLEQEMEMDEAVEDVLQELELSQCESHYDKVYAIYDYICNHVTYDYEHLGNQDYKLQFTAYAALTEGTAVCQGYANLFYRLAKEAGLSPRIVCGWQTSTGGNHAWNIVKIGNWYYNLDATWDSAYAEAGYDYAYFLKGWDTFDDHTFQDEYISDEFMAEYPMTTKAYSLHDNESETEPNNSSATATPIAVNNEYWGSIADSADIDFYKFTTNRLGAVSVKFSYVAVSSRNEVCVVTLMDSSGKEYAREFYYSDSEQDIPLPTIGLNKGIYYIVVEGRGGSGSDYGITAAFTESAWESELNDSKQTADNIVVNKTYQGNIFESGDVDYYKFVTDSTGMIEVKSTYDLLVDWGEESPSWSIKLYDEKGNLYRCDESPYVVDEEIYKYIEIPAGTHYLVVACDGGAAYTVEVNWTKCMSMGLNVTTKASNGKPMVTWNAVKGAEKYEVWRKVGNTGTWKKQYTTAGTEYINTSAETGKKYYYKVRAVYKDTGEVSSFCASDYVTCDLAKPTGLKVTTRASDGKPTVSWNKVSGADKYEVWRKVGSSGTWARQYTTKGTSYTNTSATVGKAYYYKVKAIYEDNTNANSAFSTSDYVTCDLAKPTGLKVTTVASSGKPTVSWNKVSGADKYEVWRKVGSSGTWKKQYTTKGTSYTNTSTTAGKVYYYKVKALYSGNSAANSAFSASDYVTCDLAKPTGLKVTTVASSGKPTVSWNKVSGADKYEVWRKIGSSGTWKKQYTTKGTSYTNTSATAGKVYYYKIKAIYEDNTIANSAFSASDYVTCDLAKPSITVSGTKKPGKIVISWKKISGADRYYIYRATSKSGTYSKYDSTTGTTYTNSSVTRGKYYYYKVKAVYDDRSAANSAYSNMDYAWVR